MLAATTIMTLKTRVFPIPTPLLACQNLSSTNPNGSFEDRSEVAADYSEFVVLVAGQRGDEPEFRLASSWNCATIWTFPHAASPGRREQSVFLSLPGVSW